MSTNEKKMLISASELVKNYLSQEGFYHEVDSDGDIKFKFEGLPMLFYGDKDDPLFFRLIIPGAYTVENNRIQVLEAINETTKEYKVAKGFLVNDDLWVSIELFLDESPEIDDIMPRCCEIMKQYIISIAHRIQGE